MSILLIDDDAEDRDLFCQAVTEISPTLKFTVSKSAEDAFEEIRSSKIAKPELIFLDLCMPKVDGFQCLLNLKTNKHLSSIPVVIYAASNLLTDISLSLELGASNYITKPLTIQKIGGAIQFFLRLHNIF
jgi:CheY-like chemotaxis protein